MAQQNAPEQKKPEVNISQEIKAKKGFWGKFLTFLMMGGFIVVLIVIVALFIGISILFKCK
jgi:ABC-type transport system involved in multi-copper enzyme maturation permease subunit